MGDFLSDLGPGRPWRLPEGAPAGFSPLAFHLGQGRDALEVALAGGPAAPRPGEVRDLWRRRHGGTASPLLLVVLHGPGAEGRATVCGPWGEDPPVVAGLACEDAARLARAALAQPNRHAAGRFLVDALASLDGELPGLRNEGLLAAHELRTGVPARPDWAAACERGRALLGRGGRELLEGLGFRVEARDSKVSLLRAGENGTAAAVAVFLDEGESYEAPAARFDGESPVSLALARADADRLPFAVITRGPELRLYVADPRLAGVGRRGRTETFVGLNLALLPAAQAGYLPLLFGAEALLPGGSFEQVLEASRTYAADLSRRLRERVYGEVVPALAAALARRLPQDRRPSEEELAHLYEASLVLLFRLVFIAYAEDKGLLPYGTSGAYREHSLKGLARRLAERRNEQGPEPAFDPAATDLWQDLRALFAAVARGNSEWQVPAYDGGLFADDPEASPAGALLAAVELSNAELGPALCALLTEETEEGAFGPVDFRSLSVREFGTIYEGLLESGLALAPCDLALDGKGNYVPARDGDRVAVPAGGVYLHGRSGARKSSGSFFTPAFAVEHLLEAALEPVLDEHLARLEALLAGEGEAAAAEAFFDLRVADLAMGSGHFLVHAVDRIERRLSAFLADHPLAGVRRELAALRAVARERLGPAGEGVEIEDAALLRRQIARRCLYGVDKNPVAVELARLALWVHTFVPGLPLSFLDRTLVCGDSLTGVGTVEEALAALGGAGDTASLARPLVDAALEAARAPLARLARLSDATPDDLAEARRAAAEAEAALALARSLCDLVLAARLGEAEPLAALTAPEGIAGSEAARRAGELARRLGALHFPLAFPEVFSRQRPGFDCIVGNPPWEKLHVETHAFWALRFPGLRSLPVARQNAEVERLMRVRPDLVAEYEREVERAREMRRALLAGPYPGLGESHPDLYKAFAWRFWQLVREGGRVGVVLPRSALSAKGGEAWRRAVLAEGEFAEVTFLANRGGWVFPDAEHRYTLALTALRKGREDGGRVRLRGPYRDAAALAAGSRAAPLEVAAEEFASWTETCSFPLLPDERAGRLFLALRRQPRLDADAHPFRVRAVQGDFNSTKGKVHMLLAPDSTARLWPVYKGESFDLWRPDRGPASYYAWIRPETAERVLMARRRNQARTRASAFSGLPEPVLADPATLPCRRPRIAFRRVARATDSRTLICALVPPGVVLTDVAPYLLFREGDERDEAFLLGVLASLVLDWYARRVVETHVDFFVLHPLPVPAPPRDHPLRRRVEELAGRLAAVDGRYAAWARAVGVPLASVAVAERADLLAELDAAVALLYGLDEAALGHLFSTFHEGWDHRDRLARTLAHFRRLGGCA